MLHLTLRKSAGAHHLARALSTRSSGILSSLGLPTSGEPVAGVYHHHAQGWHGSGELQHSLNPATGEVLARVQTASPAEVDAALGSARRAYEAWRTVPAPKRGEVLRQVRVALNERIDDLGKLVSLEMGKVLSGKFAAQQLTLLLLLSSAAALLPDSAGIRRADETVMRRRGAR